MKFFSTPVAEKYSDHSHQSKMKEKDQESEANSIVDEVNSFTDKVRRMALTPRRTHHHSHKKAEQKSMEKHDLWRQEQKSGAAMLEKQLKAQWSIEDLIDKQLKRFHAHYNQTMVMNRLEDVSQVLMPKWTPPLELASMSWLGDWRPSAILELLQSLVQPSVETDHKLISKLIREVRIEEAIIDEEMTEIQANCILNLPFISAKNSPLSSVRSELSKIKQVIIKAQQLRYKVLVQIVKKVLSQFDAAEFLVAFAGIQDAIHQYADHQRSQTAPVSFSVKALGTV